MGLTCNPPKPGGESYEKISKEVTSIKNSYRKKAKMTTEVLNSMENVKCNDVAGAMYAFPRITLPKKYIQGQGNATRRVLLLAGAGENWNLHDSWPRFLYERQRITILPSEETFAPMFERLRTFHQEFMAQFKDTN
ncbi:alanine aminotransferase 2-like [Porites lutea]|uniref:alanine aminotransferase 2-like n=1 Tax=Porites lutea TaxID=51062 RepID=UPI003CC6D616